MNTIFRNLNELYKIVRETPKMYFYKKDHPRSTICRCQFSYMCLMLIQQFKKYNPNNIALDDTELKILKSKFQPNQIINENELGNHFLKCIYLEEITQITVSNHLIY